MYPVVFTVTNDFVDVQDESPANIYLFKVNNRDTRKRCKIF